MALDLLAVPQHDATNDAAVPQFSLIEFTHCQEAKWVTLPISAKTGLWPALLESDQAVRLAMQRLAAPNPQPTLAAFMTRFEDLYDRIFSSQARDLLHREADRAGAGTTPVLRLHLMPGLDVVPWELLFDGKDFLGLRFQVARLPIVPGGPPEENGAAHEVRKIVSVLAENVLEDSQEQEWRTTFDNLVGVPITIWRRPQQADWPTVNDLYGQAAGDVVHVTCHGIVKGADRFWSLNHNQLLDDNYRLYVTAHKTFQVSATAPLVFANACASANSGPALEGVPASLGEGFGTTFYDNGARTFIGTFAPVTQSMAVNFAKRFFKHLFGEQLSVGEALVATKKEFRDEAPVDPSWLFYCLYGDPQAKFVLSET